MASSLGSWKVIQAIPPSQWARGFQVGGDLTQEIVLLGSGINISGLKRFPTKRSADMSRIIRSSVNDFRFLNPLLDAVGGQWVNRDSVNGKRLTILLVIWFSLGSIWLMPASVHGTYAFFGLVHSLLVAMVLTWIIFRVAREIRAGMHARSRSVAGSLPPSTALRDPSRSISSIQDDLEHMSKQHSLLEARSRG